MDGGVGCLRGWLSGVVERMVGCGLLSRWRGGDGVVERMVEWGV